MVYNSFLPTTVEQFLTCSKYTINVKALLKVQSVKQNRYDHLIMRNVKQI